MKIFGFALTVLLLLSCAKPRNEVRYFVSVTKPDSLATSRVYEMKINDTIVTGYVYSNFVRKDTAAIEGIISETGNIRWMEFDNLFHKPDNFYHGILSGTGAIVYNPDLKLKDYNMFDRHDLLAPVDKNTFNQKKALLFPTVQKTTWVRTVSDEKFIIDVRVEDWDTEDFTGKTTFTIKDQASGNVIQQIKTDRFQCNKYVNFWVYDCNFDNLPDLVVPIGPMGNRMTEINDYYLFDPLQGIFVYSDDFTSACSGIGTEFDEKKKRIISTSTSGAGAMSIAYLIDGLSVTPWKKAEVNYMRYDSYEIEIHAWKDDTWELLKYDSVTPKQFNRDKYPERFLSRYLN